jgi:hypothetical protein
MIGADPDYLFERFRYMGQSSCSILTLHFDASTIVQM